MKLSEDLGNSSGSLPVSHIEALSKVRREFCKVLVVDDSELLADMLATVLQIDGFSARGVYGGAQAITACDEDVPDIAFIDISMPDVDGLAVARHVRSSQREKRTLLVALTGWAEDSVKEDAMGAGFDLFMPKPLDPTSIREFISALVSGQTESGDQIATG